jgi:hypothetical protein
VAPTTKAGVVESIRVLRVAFTSARRTRTQVAPWERVPATVQQRRNRAAGPHHGADPGDRSATRGHHTRSVGGS